MNAKILEFPKRMSMEKLLSLDDTLIASTVELLESDPNENTFTMNYGQTLKITFNSVNDHTVLDQEVDNYANVSMLLHALADVHPVKVKEFVNAYSMIAARMTRPEQFVVRKHDGMATVFFHHQYVRKVIAVKVEFSLLD